MDSSVIAALEQRVQQCIPNSLRLRDADILDLLEKRWRLDSEMQAALVPQAIMYFAKGGANLTETDRDLLRDTIMFVDIQGTDPALLKNVANDDARELASLNKDQQAYAAIIDRTCATLIVELLEILRSLWGQRLFLRLEFERAIAFWSTHPGTKKG